MLISHPSSLVCVRSPVATDTFGNSVSGVAFTAEMDSSCNEKAPSCSPKKLNQQLGTTHGNGESFKFRPSHHNTESFDVCRIKARCVTLLFSSICGFHSIPGDEQSRAVGESSIFRDLEIIFITYG